MQNKFHFCSAKIHICSEKYIFVVRNLFCAFWNICSYWPSGPPYPLDAQTKRIDFSDAQVWRFFCRMPDCVLASRIKNLNLLDTFSKRTMQVQTILSLLKVSTQISDGLLTLRLNKCKPSKDPHFCSSKPLSHRPNASIIQIIRRADISTEGSIS